MSTILVKIALAAACIGLPKGPEAGVIQPGAGTEPLVVIHSAAKMAVSGRASWYRWRPGEAAAGPALRRALGHWRGRVVHVNGIPVRLTDWCQCYGSRVIDLDRRTFAAITDPARGLVKVTVTW